LHVKENGVYPETVSVVLWAFETMKTGGETIGQIFNYLGVRAVKNKSIWTTEFEVIPQDEMNHPRINVLTTICGIFRDTFPYLLELINKAIEAVAELEEPPEFNFVRKRMLEMEKDNVENPGARVFGPPPGKYNTNVTDIISAGKWNSEEELVDDYITNMCYAYMKNRKIERSPETFSKTIKKIDMMSQIRDSSEYTITDLDHYYLKCGHQHRPSYSNSDSERFVKEPTKSITFNLRDSVDNFSSNSLDTFPISIISAQFSIESISLSINLDMCGIFFIIYSRFAPNNLA